MTKARELSELAHLTSVSGTTATVDGTISATTLTGDGSSITGINTEPFKPVAVSGSTPILNLGLYNFFDNGALTEDTTVSFSNVPTNSRWQYSFKAGDIGQYDIANLTFAKSISGAGYGTNLHGIYISDDGYYLTLVQKGSNYIVSYYLPTAWDLAGAYANTFYGAGNEETNPTGVSYKPDGTRMYIVGHTNDKCFVYNLSSAWQLNTAVKSSDEFYFGNQDGIPQEIYFRPDGLKMYMVGYVNKRIYEYDLSTAWDVTTSVYAQSFLLSAQGNDPESVVFDPTGTKLYTMESTGKTINQYYLNTAWDISTTVFSKYVAVTVDTVPVGLYMKPDGSRMYLTGDTTNNIFQFNMGSVAAVTLPSSVKGTTTTPVVGKRTTYNFFTMDTGTTVNLISEDSI